jgi:ABC-type lipopolysaccharide export system ATPase subunit
LPDGPDIRTGLTVAGLEKGYGGRPVLRGVDLSLDRGEVVALLGPNGSGKTTCFYCIAGLVASDGGRVRSTASMPPACPCTAARGWASATCRRKCRSSAA